VEVFIDRSEPGFGDNVLIRITEECPAHSKLIRRNQLTAADARELARRLVALAGVAEDEACPVE
jgi:hypothetical protein